MKQINDFLQSKNREKLVMITAYDALFASLFNKKVDMILVGDSLNMSFGGQKDTLSASMDIMIYHTKAVTLGAPDTFTITDMPFGTCTNKKDALKNASRVYQETSAHAIKLEGGAEKAMIIHELVKNSIAVMGHIGLMPQFVRVDGGYKVKGKNELDIAKLVDDAKALEDAGVFSIVVEGVKKEAAIAISKAVKIPTIGIGASSCTDGQVLVWSDMLGFFEPFKPKFVKEYLNGSILVKNAIDKYVEEVKNGTFPSSEFEY